jgi:hypothetical protein
MSYAAVLDESYEEAKTDWCPPSTRAGFLSQAVFDFTTYDSEMDDLFGRRAVEVCAAINDGRTFDYIADEENYRWFLLMVNMPFFADRLEWGTSIRGAWWAYEDQRLKSCFLWKEGEQILDLVFGRPQWVEFIKATVEFARLAEVVAEANASRPTKLRPVR